MALPADLVLYASLNMPADDSATSGGGVDVDQRLEFTQLAVDAALEILSSAAGDTTQQATVRVRNAAGVVVSQTVTLTGTTAVQLTSLGTVDRVLKVSLNADCAGVVTLRVSGAGATVGTIPIGERGFMCIHREGAASVGSTQDFYYKGFWRNTGAATLLTPSVAEYADPAGRVTFALAASLNDTGSVANRKTAPALTFNDSQKSAPASLGPGDAIGVWFKFSHPAGESDMNSTYGTKIAGT